MSSQLRTGMEKMRKYYTEKLLEAGVIQEAEIKNDFYTLAELENMFMMTVNPQTDNDNSKALRSRHDE